MLLSSKCLLYTGSVEGSTHVESFLRELSNNPAGRRNLFQQKRRHYDADQTVFKIYKGAKTFDFSAPHNTLATGGKCRWVYALFTLL